MLQTAGIHHITAFVDDAQQNVDFYSGVLGLRLVKKTINFDAPEVYHLYFGNEGGSLVRSLHSFHILTRAKERLVVGRLIRLYMPFLSIA
ncbi:glyoxalase family protein [Paenibacillus pini JCM 16418]|uniref:Glyoxalase family protein n=1 Tax=Paenibacillus pini JCM 16418 TaxID=1236976 RepID=W7YCU8_9BACL|nr:glyoxalase family protein [Paenibacillus pini JCM 16418]